VHVAAIGSRGSGDRARPAGQSLPFLSSHPRHAASGDLRGFELNPIENAESIRISRRNIERAEGERALYPDDTESFTLTSCSRNIVKQSCSSSAAGRTDSANQNTKTQREFCAGHLSRACFLYPIFPAAFLGAADFQEHQHSLSECHIFCQHRIVDWRKIAGVKIFRRLKNYFRGCRRYDIQTIWAGRSLTTVRIDPAYKGN
jgi:hypothetical protein